MTPSTIWIALAAFLAVMEMVTGTFYLLVAALGFGAAGVVAALNGGTAAQIIVAALVSLVGWVIVYKFTPASANKHAASNPDVNPDIGATVRIATINNDGTLSVSYRGSTWGAAVENGTVALNTDYTIARVDGSKLILTPKI